MQSNRREHDALANLRLLQNVEAELHAPAVRITAQHLRDLERVHKLPLREHLQVNVVTEALAAQEREVELHT